MTRNRRLALSYGLVSVVGLAAYPLLSPTARLIDLAIVYVGSAVCVAVGRRTLPLDARLPWTFLLLGTFVLVAANVGQASTRSQVIVVGLLLGIVGNLLALAAALSLVVRRDARDVGGLIDAAILGFASGCVLWGLLPHHPSGDTGWAQQLHLFVVVFALPATMSPLARLMRRAGRPPAPLWWLMAALFLAFVGQLLYAVSDRGTPVRVVSTMLFLVTFAAVGQFSLDPEGVRLTQTLNQVVAVPDRLTVGRLIVLSFAIDAVPAVAGLREFFGARPSGLVLVVQGLIMSGLVMARIGLLATERQRAEMALAYLANHDPLTQLPNRHLLVAGLRAALARGGPVALLFCDLDEFKLINDRFGHDTGDRALIEVAQRLRDCVRPPDLVSRIGGDEFVILLADTTAAQAAVVRDRIEAYLARPSALAVGMEIRASVGVVPPGSIRDPDELMRAADAAMYAVKIGHGRAQARSQTP